MTRALRSRRIGAALGLLGMAYYAVLVPWHVVSQASAASVLSALGAAAAPLCHGASSEDDSAPKTGRPAGKTHCPICNGFAALHVASVVPAISLRAPLDAAGELAHVSDDHLAAAPLRAPQSRGPPPPLA
jgi:hypothetical protein